MISLQFSQPFVRFREFAPNDRRSRRPFRWQEIGGEYRLQRGRVFTNALHHDGGHGAGDNNEHEPDLEPAWHQERGRPGGTHEESGSNSRLGMAVGWNPRFEAVDDELRHQPFD